MPRPKRTIRPVRTVIFLPEDVYSTLTMELYSQALGRIPMGAWSGYFLDLARRDLEARAKARVGVDVTED